MSDKGCSFDVAFRKAVCDGNLEIVKAFLDIGFRCGVDINCKTKSGKTTLMFASQKGQTEMVELLLNHGAEINAKKDDGWTALMIASHNGKTETVELLLNHGAEINAKKDDGWTALDLANNEEIETLLKNKISGQKIEFNVFDLRPETDDELKQIEEMKKQVAELNEQIKKFQQVYKKRKIESK